MRVIEGRYTPKWGINSLDSTTCIFFQVELLRGTFFSLMEIDEMRSKLLTVKDIVGDPKASPPVPGLLPIGAATWRRGVKDGIYPAAVRVSKRKLAWKESEVQRVVDGLLGVAS